MFDVSSLLIQTKVKNIDFDGYIGTWILRIYLRIYKRYIDGYFYMNIDKSEINKFWPLDLILDQI